jgi:pimeloyl-ACP methyl ester carboxylesterase
MPIDSTTGVYYELHGSGEPLLIGLPLMASHVEIFGSTGASILKEYLEGFTDRYRVLLVDYPSIGKSADIAPQDLTAERVCNDLLSVATAAGFDHFAYFGYSWSGAVGLQLASRTKRLSALIIGGWPPLQAPYAELLQATLIKQANPEPSSLTILRSKAQYTQWEHYYRSTLSWPEAQSVANIKCPKMVFFGAQGDLIEAGIPINIASLIRKCRLQLEAQHWHVVEIAEQGHGVTMMPSIVLPPVRAFLDSALF